MEMGYTIDDGRKAAKKNFRLLSGCQGLNINCHNLGKLYACRVDKI